MPETFTGLRLARAEAFAYICAVMTIRESFVSRLYITLLPIALIIFSCVDKKPYYEDVVVAHTPLKEYSEEGFERGELGFVSDSIWIFGTSKRHCDTVYFFRSEDAGQHWDEVSRYSSGLICRNITYVDNLLFAGIRQNKEVTGSTWSLLVSDDLAQSWKTLYECSDNGVVSFKAYSKDVIAISLMDSLICTRNSGKAWDVVYDDISYYHSCSQLGLLDVTSSGHLLVTDPWTYKRDTIVSLRREIECPNYSNGVFAFQGGLHGVSFSEYDSGTLTYLSNKRNLTDSSPNSAKALYSNGDIYYAEIGNSYGGKNRLYISCDHAKTWHFGIPSNRMKLAFSGKKLYYIPVYTFTEIREIRVAEQ